MTRRSLPARRLALVARALTAARPTAARLTAARLAVALLAVALFVVGCAKPTGDECKKAIENIDRIHGITNTVPVETAAAVRKCRTAASKESVLCMRDATDEAALTKCGGQPAPAAPAAPATPAVPAAPAR